MIPNEKPAGLIVRQVFVSDPSPEQAIDGFAVVFAERVPKGDVDARDGYEDEALRVRAQAQGREQGWD